MGTSADSCQACTGGPLQGCAKRLWSECGLLLAAAAGFIYSCNAVLVKLTKGRVPVSEIIFLRGSISVLFSISLAAYVGVRPLYGQRRHWPLLLARGLLGTISVACSFSSFILLPLGDAVTVSQLRPPVAAVVARLLLGEPLGLQAAAGCLVSLCGVVILARPPLLFGSSREAAWSKSRLLGMGLGVTCTVTVALVAYCIRRIGTKESTLTIALWFHSAAVLLSLGPLLLGVPQAPSLPKGSDLLLVLGISGATFSAQLLQTRALQVTPVTRVAAMGFATVVYGHAFGAAVFGEEVSSGSILGTLVVLLGVVLVVFKPDAAQDKLGQQQQQQQEGEEGERSSEGAEEAQPLLPLSNQGGRDDRVWERNTEIKQQQQQQQPEEQGQVLELHVSGGDDGTAALQLQQGRDQQRGKQVDPSGAAAICWEDAVPTSTSHQHQQQHQQLLQQPNQQRQQLWQQRKWHSLNL